MRGYALSLGRVVRNIEVYGANRGNDVVGKDVVFETKCVLDLRFKDRRSPLPLSERCGEGDKARAIGHGFLPTRGEQDANPRGTQKHKRSRNRRAAWQGLIRC